MEDEAFRAMARAAQANEIEAGAPGWHYLSFADDTSFIGGLVIHAFGFMDAIMQAHLRGLNPGGEVMHAELPEAAIPPERFRNRLLSKDEVKEMWPDAKSIREHEEDEAAVPMSDEKPSPGPWLWEIDLGDSSQVCDFGGGLKWEESAGTPPSDADAALIADAPAMLALLRDHEFITDGTGGTRCPECYCPTDPGKNNHHHSACRLGALLDKHGRTP